MKLEISNHYLILLMRLHLKLEILMHCLILLMYLVVVQAKMQPQAVPFSDFSILTKPASSKIVISSDPSPDPSAILDSGGVISQGFCVPSNHDPHISRL